MSVNVKTEHVYPPIPIRSWDWLAYIAGEEEGFIGRGPTEQAAIEDLKTSLDEAEEWAPRCPECGSERIGGPVIAFSRETHGECQEQVYLECLDCKAKFEE